MQSGWARCTAFSVYPWAVQQDMRPEERRRNYNDITYATNSELGFDYLRDNMAADISE